MSIMRERDIEREDKAHTAKGRHILQSSGSGIRSRIPEIKSSPLRFCLSPAAALLAFSPT
jgi:hypothetical protein